MPTMFFSVPDASFETIGRKHLFFFFFSEFVLKSSEREVRTEIKHFNMGVLGVVAKRLDAFVGPGIMLVFPLYASLRAIESPSTLDDQQWLTYWIIYSFVTLFELSCWRILVWLPFWPYMKLLFCMWLVLPVFNGAAYIYENLVRKYVKFGSTVTGNYTEERKKVLQMMSLDARKSVIQYVDKNGWTAVEKAIKAAEREVKKTS